MVAAPRSCGRSGALCAGEIRTHCLYRQQTRSALPASCAGLFNFACGGAGHGSWFHSLGDGGSALSCVLSISVSIGIRDLATKVRS